MPVYEYMCPKCEVETDKYNKVDNRHTEAPACGKCEVQMELQVSTPATPVMNPARPVKKPRSM
jgi:putative FmdB family regulatory protein